jgi:hypothetical protein
MFSRTRLNRPLQPHHLLIRPFESFKAPNKTMELPLGWDPRNIFWQWAKSILTITIVRTSIRSLRPFLGTFARSSTCWVVIVNISLLLFTITIIQLLMGGKNFFLYANAQAHTRGRILQQYKHNNKGLLSMVAPFQTLDTQDGHLF